MALDRAALRDCGMEWLRVSGNQHTPKPKEGELRTGQRNTRGAQQRQQKHKNSKETRVQLGLEPEPIYIDIFNKHTHM